MYIVLLLTLATLHTGALASTWEYSFPGHWEAQWPVGEVINDEDADVTACTTSHIGAFEMAKPETPISLYTGPLDDFESPKIVPLNSSATEQWEFDSGSDGVMDSFIFGFYRDPGLSLMGFGNLRLSDSIPSSLSGAS
ncbi:hypothetical protein BDV12DRAFT_205086 [Aspergillus spectabilis]